MPSGLSTPASLRRPERPPLNGIHCFDNAACESFFATLKRELGENFKDLADAERQLFDYIESFYNGERSHSTLGYASPLEFEKARAAA